MEEGADAAAESVAEDEAPPTPAPAADDVARGRCTLDALAWLPWAALGSYQCPAASAPRVAPMGTLDVEILTPAALPGLSELLGTLGQPLRTGAVAATLCFHSGHAALIGCLLAVHSVPTRSAMKATTGAQALTTSGSRSPVRASSAAAAKQRI